MTVSCILGVWLPFDESRPMLCYMALYRQWRKTLLEETIPMIKADGGGLPFF